jgi:hypothetical protein
MGEVLLNGRPAGGELPESVIRRAAGQGRQQARDLLAGVLTAAPEPRHEGRPVTDLLLEFSRVRRVAS